MLVSRLITIGAVLCLGACNDPAQGVSAAEVGPPGPSTASTRRGGAAGRALKITPHNSTIQFEGSKVTGSHNGGFRDFEGTLTLQGDAPQSAQIDITIDTGSVFADSEKLATHLKNDDFFDVPNFPKAVFTSAEVRAGGEGGATHTIVGDLELRGKRNRITFPATVRVDDEKVTATAEFSINRRDFGMLYAGKEDNLIRDLVVIRLKLNLSRS